MKSRWITGGSRVITLTRDRVRRCFESGWWRNGENTLAVCDIENEAA